MTLTIDLSDEQTLVLNARAKAQGVSTEQYARSVLEHDLAPDWLRESWESAKEAGLNGLSMDEIDAEVAAGRKAWPQPGSCFGRSSTRMRRVVRRLRVAAGRP